MSTAPASTETPRSNFSPHEKPSWDLYSRCVHCGLCLDQCPTYRALGTEMDSPRGRIYQIVQVDAGATGAERFVCYAHRSLPGLPELPDGVSVGRGVRQPAGAGACADRRKLPAAVAGDKGAQTFLWRHAAVVPSPRASRAVHALLSAFGVAVAGSSDRNFEAARDGGVGRAVAAHRQQVFVCRSRARVSRRKASGAAEWRLLIGCVASVAFAELNRATIRVLTKNGIEVHVPEKQACCGALQLHAGDTGSGARAGATQHRRHAQPGVRRHRD